MLDQKKFKVAISLSNKQLEFGILLKSRLVQQSLLRSNEVFMHYSNDTQDNAISNDPTTYFYQIFQDCEIAVLLLSKDYPLPNQDGNQYCMDELRGAISNENNINTKKVILPFFYHSKEEVINNFMAYNTANWNKFGNTIIASTLIDDWQKGSFDCIDCKFKNTICKKKLGYCRNQQIDRIINIVVNKLAELYQEEDKDLMKLDFGLNSSNDISISKPQVYKNILHELDEFERGVETKSFKLERDHFNSELLNLIKNQNLIFVEGALLTGKSSAMFRFTERHSKDFSFIYSDPTPLGYKTKLTDKKKVYFKWLKQVIAEFKLKNGSQQPKSSFLKKQNTLNELYIANIDNYQFFLEEIDKNKEFIETNDLASFIRIINKCNNIINSKITLILAIHLDDFHKYADKDVFDQIREDLIDYRNKYELCNYKALKVKLIIITRYFPSTKPKHNVILIDDLTINDLRILLTPLFISENLEKNIIELTIKEIQKRTKGHAWFVFRIIRAYLNLRIKGCKFSSIKLIDEVIRDINIWYNNDDLYENTRMGSSDYIIELKSILEEFPQYRDSFYQFLSSTKTQVRINDEKFRNNPILRQTGLIRNNKSEHFSGYSNEVIDLHYTKEKLTNQMI